MAEIVARSTMGFFPPPGIQKEAIYFNTNGGAEWPGASVDPRKNVIYIASSETTSLISVINANQFDTSETLSLPGRKGYEEFCQSCHGNNRQGGSAAPPLFGDEFEKFSVSQIKKIINNGQKGMPSLGYVPETTKELIADYLKIANEIGLKNSQNPNKSSNAKYVFGGWKRLLDSEGYPGNKPPWGWLTALNLNTGKIIWRTPLGDDEKLARRGLKNIGTENMGAPVATAGGLIFCAGTTDRLLRAFDSDTGKELWSYKLPAYGSAAPSIYEINGNEYLLIPATGGNSSIKGKASDKFLAFTIKK